MANAPITGPPGVARDSSGYPQYGVIVGTGSGDASVGPDSIVVARNAQQKTADISKGALTWFTSRQAAQEFISSQTSALGGGLTSFLGRLEEGSTWVRVAEVLIGAALIIAGVAKLASGTPVGRAAESAGKAAMIL